jgi:UPF0716 protein FxsA
MPLLVLLLLVVPIAELYVIIQVGGQIGVLPTIAILIADSLLGAWLLRREGRAVWQRFRTTIEGGSIPAKETVDGVLVIAGGALLLTPGFLTDGIGVAMILPPTRALIRRLLMHRVTWAVAARTPGGGAAYMASTAARARPARRPADIDTTATEID